MLRVQSQTSRTEPSLLGIPAKAGCVSYEELRGIYGAGPVPSRPAEAISRRRSLDLPRKSRRSRNSLESSESSEPASPWSSLSTNSSPGKNSKSNSLQPDADPSTKPEPRPDASRARPTCTGARARLPISGRAAGVDLLLDASSRLRRSSDTVHPPQTTPPQSSCLSAAQAGQYPPQPVPSIQVAAVGTEEENHGSCGDAASDAVSLTATPCRGAETATSLSKGTPCDTGVEIFFFQDQPLLPRMNLAESETFAPGMTLPGTDSVHWDWTLPLPCQPPQNGPVLPPSPGKVPSFPLPNSSPPLLFLDKSSAAPQATAGKGISHRMTDASPSTWAFAPGATPADAADSPGESDFWEYLGNVTISCSAAASQGRFASSSPGNCISGCTAGMDSPDPREASSKDQSSVARAESQDWSHPSGHSGAALGLSSLRRSQSGIPAGSGQGAPAAQPRPTSPLSLPCAGSAAERPVSSGGRTSRFAQEEQRALSGTRRDPKLPVMSRTPGLLRTSSAVSIACVHSSTTLTERRSRPAVERAAGDILQSNLLQSRSALRPTLAIGNGTSVLSSPKPPPAAVLSQSPQRYMGSKGRRRVSIDLGRIEAEGTHGARLASCAKIFQPRRSSLDLGSAGLGRASSNEMLLLSGVAMDNSSQSPNVCTSTRGGLGPISKRPERQNSLPSFVSMIPASHSSCAKEKAESLVQRDTGNVAQGQEDPLSFEAAFSRCCKLEKGGSGGSVGSPSQSPSALKPILVLRQEGLQHARSLGRRVQFKNRVDVVVFS